MLTRLVRPAVLFALCLAPACRGPSSSTTSGSQPPRPAAVSGAGGASGAAATPGAGNAGQPSVALGPAIDLRVTFLGTGAPRPSFERYGPSVLVEAGAQRILVDPSSGLRERLLHAGSYELISGIDHVLVTHLHYDHTVGLPDLWLTGWLYGRRTPLVVEGPVGIKAMMSHIEQAFSWDTKYRELVGVPAAGVAIEAQEIGPGVVFEKDGLKVTAFDVEHMPIDLKTRKHLPFDGQTLGLRFDYRGRSLVLSGDTRPADNVVTFGRGADVLVHEVQVPAPDETTEAKLANVSLSVHTEPKDAADIFTRAKPKMAVYSHIIPPEATEAQLRAATPYSGPLTVAHDLMMITIGEQITVTDRPRAAVKTFEQSGAVRQ